MNGVREGAWRYFDADGALEKEGVYRAGERDGAWRRYDAAGNVVATERYEAGKRVE